jgi:hypothetical protein
MRLSCLVSIFCLVCVSSSAQQSTPAPTTSDPQAVALLQRALAALIGNATVSDITLTGTAQRIAGSDNETGTATVAALAGGYSKITLSFPSGARGEIRNASGIPLPGALPSGTPASAAQSLQPVGAWSGPDGVLHPIVSHNLMTDASWFFPVFTLSNLLSPQVYILSYIGQDTLDNQAVLHISAVQQFPGLSNAPSQITGLAQHLSQMDIYLNPSSLLPVALSFSVHQDNDALIDIPVEIQFSGYQVFNGVQVPLHVQKYLSYALVLDLQLNSAALNSGLTAATFQLQ